MPAERPSKVFVHSRPARHYLAGLRLMTNPIGNDGGAYSCAANLYVNAGSGGNALESYAYESFGVSRSRTTKGNLPRARQETTPALCGARVVVSLLLTEIDAFSERWRVSLLKDCSPDVLRIRLK